MATYNTGNPLGSSDPRDLYDNAENLDNLVNGEQPAYSDRLGKSRRSWQSVEDQANQQEAEFNADQAQRVSEFDAAQRDREGVFNAYLVSAGYQFAGDYAAGIEITQYNQVVRDTNGELWRVSGSTTLPYTTTGAGLPEGGAFVNVGDAALRQELAQTGPGKGISLIGGLPFVTPQMFGAAGDGITDDTQALQDAVDYCVQMGRQLFVPSGVYLIDDEIYLSNLTADGQGLTMTGEGRGKSIIKEKDGSTARRGRFAKMFYFWHGASGEKYRAGAYTFQDLTFNKNGASNGQAPSSYAWEQAHIFSWASSGGTRECGAITFRQCEFVDKVGASINMPTTVTGVTHDSVVIDDCQSIDHPGLSAGLYGQRGDFEFGMYANSVSLTNVTANYAQIEPVVTSTITNQRRYRVSDSTINTLEFTDSSPYSHLDVVSVTCRNKLLVRGMTARITGGEFRVPDIFWSYDLKIIGSTIRLAYDNVTNSTTAFKFAPVSGSDPNSKMRAVGVSFVIDSDDPNITPTGFAVTGGNVSPDAADFIRIFDGCDFDPRFEKLVNAYGRGHYIFNGCNLYGRTTLGSLGATSTTKGHLELNNCKFKQDDPSNNFLDLLLNDPTNWTFRFSGPLKVGEMRFSKSGSITSPANFPCPLVMSGDSLPTAGWWPAGTVVKNSTPAVGQPAAWIRVSDGSDASGWKQYGVVADIV